MIGKLFQYISILSCCVFVVIAYVWFISTGLWITWPATTNYYDRLARSFQEGHLYIDTKLDPALLKLSDPYEPDSRKTIKGIGVDEPNTIWDMALYKGKIYLYWGPAPALFLAAIKLFYKDPVGDQKITLVFIAGLFLFESLILLRVWRRFFRDLPTPVVLSCIFLIGFVNPIPWILNIPRIYEAAIAGGQFFFVGGLYFIFAGLDRPNPSIWRLAAAAIFWVFAVGSRATMGIPISFLVLMVLLMILKGPGFKMDPDVIKQVAGFGIPLLIGAAGLCWYNQARFDSILEFGFRYEITMLNQNRLQGDLFSPIYAIPNLYLYLFNPPFINSLFPFIRPVWNEGFISNFNNYYHTIYNAERIAGLIYAFPFSIFALVAFGKLITGSINKWHLKQTDREKTISESNINPFTWMLIGLSGCLVLEFLIVLIIFYGTMRYFMDATPTLALISIFGFWQGYLALNNKPVWKKVFTAVGFTLLVVSIVISVLLAFSSDAARIRLNNPALLTHLRLFFTHIMNYPGK